MTTIVYTRGSWRGLLLQAPNLSLRPTILLKNFLSFPDTGLISGQTMPYQGLPRANHLHKFFVLFYVTFLSCLLVPSVRGNTLYFLHKSSSLRYEVFSGAAGSVLYESFSRGHLHNTTAQHQWTTNSCRRRWMLSTLLSNQWPLKIWIMIALPHISGLTGAVYVKCWRNWTTTTKAIWISTIDGFGLDHREVRSYLQYFHAIFSSVKEV